MKTHVVFPFRVFWYRSFSYHIQDFELAQLDTTTVSAWHWGILAQMWID